MRTMEFLIRGQIGGMTTIKSSKKSLGTLYLPDRAQS